jgi:predicted N-formylglutamate amidohydrolase
MRKDAPALMITCEHASNAVPGFVVRAFKAAGLAGIPEDVLKTHRGYDIGALKAFRKLVRTMRPDFSLEGTFSRLVADLNRSDTNRSFYSEYTRDLPESVKEQVHRMWLSHRDSVEKYVAGQVKGKGKGLRVIHLGIHSFTPKLNGKVRNTDIGILYDPARPQERAYANVIKAEIKRLYPAMKVRFNYPYKGTSDGLTTTLRKKFGARYAGIEIEINQKFFQR